MKDDKKIEQTIYEQFNERKPELFNEIMKHCPKMEEPEKQSVFENIKNIFFNRKFSYSFASLSLILIFVFVILGQRPGNTPYAYSRIAIDVNPSLVIELNEDDTVYDVIMNNQDAEIIIGDMDLKGVDYDVAINAIIGSMVSNGYISELTNSVLLSISSDDQLHEDELMTLLSQKIQELLTSNQIQGSIITQKLDIDLEEKELAELLGISEAKAELILDIIEKDPRMTLQELATLSINDLNLLLESKNISLENVNKQGSASVLGIITVEQAFQNALEELSLNQEDVLDFEIELEQEDGVIVYEIDLETTIQAYYVLINAKTGAIYIDIDEDDELPEDVLSEQEIIDLIALELGLNKSLISEFELELESDNGVAYYDIRFDYNDLEYELEIDAVTGEIYTNSMDHSGFDYESDKEEESDEEELDD